MERTYDIFEVLPDGLLEWLEFVSGHEEALERARVLAAASPNEFRVMHLPTNSVVAVFNAKESPSESSSKGSTRKKGGSGQSEARLRPPRHFRPGIARNCAIPWRLRVHRRI